MRHSPQKHCHLAKLNAFLIVQTTYFHCHSVRLIVTLKRSIFLGVGNLQQLGLDYTIYLISIQCFKENILPFILAQQRTKNLIADIKHQIFAAKICA